MENEQMAIKAEPRTITGNLEALNDFIETFKETLSRTERAKDVIAGIHDRPKEDKMAMLKEKVAVTELTLVDQFNMCTSKLHQLNQQLSENLYYINEKLL